MIHKSKSLSKKNAEDKKPGSARPKLRALFKPFKFTEWAIILGVILLGTSGVIYQKHEQKAREQLNIAPTSSQFSQNTQASNTLNTNTPTQATQSITTTSPGDSSSTHCTDETIPFTATSEDSASLPAGQTQVVGLGKNGYNVVCDGKIVKAVQPFNIIVVTGTGANTNLEPSTITPTQPNIEPYQNTPSTNSSGLTESQAAQQCDNNLANGADASDPQGYLDSCMQQYGY